MATAADIQVRERASTDLTLLGLSVIRSVHVLMRACGEKTGRVVNVDCFQSQIAVDVNGIGSITFSSESPQLNEDLQGILPYKCILFNAYITAAHLDEMRRRRITNEPWEIMQRRGDRQRHYLRMLRTQFQELCMLQHENVSEGEFKTLLKMSVTYDTSNTIHHVPTPKHLCLQYLGTRLELAFPPVTFVRRQ